MATVLKTMTRRGFILAAALLPASCARPPDPGPDLVVFLVRHAEKADGPTEDPPLSDDGWMRARSLAALLRDAGLTHIHSTETLRTLSTAGPVSEATGLPVIPYEVGGLQEVARAIRATPGRHLVVGHSNTTPELVRLLGGDAGEPIQEAEYNRLYVLTLRPDGSFTTVCLRLPSDPT